MVETRRGGTKRRTGSILRKVLSTLSMTHGNTGIYIFALVWTITILLGFFGYQRFYELRGEQVASSDILYQTLCLFALRGADLDWSFGYVLALDIARWSALLVFFWSAALIISRALLGPLHRLRLWLCSDHVIICGMGRIGSSFARTLSEEHQMVVVEKDHDDQVDEDLKGANVVHVQGNATAEKVLRRAGISRARYLITALEEDSDNAEVVVQARKLVQGRASDPLTCYVHVLDPELCQVLRVREFNTGSPSLRLEFYNVFENSARIVMNEFPAFSETGDDRSPIGPMLIIGLDDRGQALLLRAAKRWRPSFQRTGRPLPITLVDKDARAVLTYLNARNPSLQRVCTFKTVEMDARQLKVAKDEDLVWLDSSPPASIYICVPSDSDGLSLAFVLRKRLGKEGAPIVVCMNADSKPAALLGEEGKDAGLSDIHTFGFWDRTCTKALIENGSRELMGQAIHEEYCLEQRSVGTLTSASLLSWDELSEELRESNRAQADHIIQKVNAIGCSIDSLKDWSNDPKLLTPYEVHKLSRLEHERWCQEKERKGWRYGVTRNDALKVHDDLVPWNELTPEAQYKDIATVKKIPRTLARVDLQFTCKDTVQQLAKALMVDKLGRDRQLGEEEASWAWRDMPEPERTLYVQEASAVIESIKAAGLAISGRGGVEEELTTLTAEESEQMSRRYHEQRASHPGTELAKDVSRWPGILIKSGLTMYRVEEARKLLEKDRKAMLMAYDPAELDAPF